MIAARRLTRAGAPRFDPCEAMSQPTHIYASTQTRRGRRWSRRRPVWPVAVTALGTLGTVAVLANELLRGLG
jgi:hypothetical protein